MVLKNSMLAKGALSLLLSIFSLSLNGMSPSEENNESKKTEDVKKQLTEKEKEIIRIREALKNLEDFGKNSKSRVEDVISTEYYWVGNTYGRRELVSMPRVLSGVQPFMDDDSDVSNRNPKNKNSSNKQKDDK